jgi:L-threonylcarbamoyladenylate synthase
VARVFACKGRPGERALPVLVADWQQLEELVLVPDRFRVKLGRLWPGAVTVILPTRRPSAASGGASLAVRIPAHDALRALLYRTGPMTGTSANGHGREPTTTVDDALASLLAPPDLVLDGGPTRGGGATTLVDVTGPEPRVLRQGGTRWDDPELTALLT